MIEISKELLEEVLNVEISEVTGMLTHKNNQSLLSYITKNCSINDGKELINIYELAHKCKEWALSKDYKLVSLSKECFLYDTQDLYDVSEQLDQWSEWFEADSEVEAIFKACEWILKEIKR